MDNIASRDETIQPEVLIRLRSGIDAIEVDTSALNFEQQVLIICDQIKPLITYSEIIKTYIIIESRF